MDIINKEIIIRLPQNKPINKIMISPVRNVWNMTFNHQIYLQNVTNSPENKINLNQTSNSTKSRDSTQLAEQ